MANPSDRFGPLRQWATFALGVAVICDAIIGAGSNTAALIVGLVLLGLVPVDVWLTSAPSPARSARADRRPVRPLPRPEDQHR